MTSDFAEGVISQCERIIANIQERLQNGALTPATALELQMLAE